MCTKIDMVNWRMIWCMSLTVASAILAAFLGPNPGIPIAPQQNVIAFTL